MDHDSVMINMFLSKCLFVIFCIFASMHGATARTSDLHYAVYKRQSGDVILAVLEYQIRHHAKIGASPFVGYRNKDVSLVLLRRLNRDGFKAQTLSDVMTDSMLFTDKRTHKLGAIYDVSKIRYTNSHSAVAEISATWGRQQGEILRCDVQKIQRHWVVTKSYCIGEI